MQALVERNGGLNPVFIALHGEAFDLFLGTPRDAPLNPGTCHQAFYLWYRHLCVVRATCKRWKREADARTAIHLWRMASSVHEERYDVHAMYDNIPLCYIFDVMLFAASTARVYCCGALSSKEYAMRRLALSAALVGERHEIPVDSIVDELLAPLARNEMSGVAWYVRLVEEHMEHARQREEREASAKRLKLQ